MINREIGIPLDNLKPTKSYIPNALLSPTFNQNLSLK